MGSGSSRLGWRPSRARVNRCRRSSFFSSLICGGSSSRATLQMENYSEETLVSSAEHYASIANGTLNPTRDYSSASSIVAGTVNCVAEIGSSCEPSITSCERSPAEDGFGNIETVNQRKFHSESMEELFSQDQVRDNYCRTEFGRSRSRAEASTSFKEQESSEPVSVILASNKDLVDGIDNSENKGVSDIFPEIMHPSVSSPEWLSDSHVDGISIEAHEDGATDVFNSNSVPHGPDVPVNIHSLGDESVQEAIPSGLGFLVANREQSQGDGGLLHVDVVSISSSIFSGSFGDTSGRGARRNSRRLFWDAFSRRSSRRHFDSPTIVFSTDNTDEHLSNDRWLLDFTGDIFDDGIGSDSTLHGRRRRRQSRTEFWERLRDGLDYHGQRTSYCPLHPDGTCLCEFTTTQESSARESISRIVMLAEALFEVLDEIHRQPVSLSLSMMSLPASESVVDSFPLKNHKKGNKVEGSDDIEQCYICLAEYEEGDKIRVLPCHHEYHMSCVDKWLKEIHGVCPLCRGDVRCVAVESSVPAADSEIPSV